MTHRGLTRRSLGRGAALLTLGAAASGPAVAWGRSASAARLATPGVPWTWGGNAFGELGDGTTAPWRSSPAAFVPPTSTQGGPATPPALSAISAGATHTCAIAVDARVYCGGTLHGADLPKRVFPIVRSLR